MKETLRLVGITALFCAVSGLVLAWANGVTREPIKKALKAEMNEALKKVLPAFDNDPANDAFEVDDNGRKWTFYPARRAGADVGVALVCVSNKGYGGRIELLLGLRADGAVHGLEVLRADGETPGLGSRIKDPGFRAPFAGRPAKDSRWAALTRDGGEIQGITGATISSRAVVEAVRGAIEAYARHAGKPKAPAVPGGAAGAVPVPDGAPTAPEGGAS